MNVTEKTKDTAEVIEETTDTEVNEETEKPYISL